MSPLFTTDRRDDGHAASAHHRGRVLDPSPDQGVRHEMNPTVLLIAESPRSASPLSWQSSASPHELPKAVPKHSPRRSHYTQHAPVEGESKRDPFALPGWLRSRQPPVALGHHYDAAAPVDLAGNPSGLTPDWSWRRRALVCSSWASGGLYGLRRRLARRGCAVAATVARRPANAGLKRQEKIQRPADALDLLTVCVEAGLGFDAALAGSPATPPARWLRFSRVLWRPRSRRARRPCARWTGRLCRAAVVRVRARAGGELASRSPTYCVNRRRRCACGGQRPRKAQKVPVKILFRWCSACSVHVRRDHRTRRDQHHPSFWKTMAWTPSAQGAEAICRSNKSHVRWARGDSSDRGTVVDGHDGLVRCVDQWRPAGRRCRSARRRRLC